MEIKEIKDEQLIRLVLTPLEGLLLGCMMDAAIQQAMVEPEELKDDQVFALIAMCKRIRPYLPSLAPPRS